MTAGTSVPSPVFGPTGFQIPATSAILTGVLTDMNAAYGGSMNLNLNTPQGQQASSLTACIDNANSIFVEYTNLVDPALSSGRMQDAIGYIYFIIRDPALPTVVGVTLSGKTGTVIPAGALAQDTSGNLYANNGSATIGGGGTVAATFSAVEPGPLACPPATLTSIYQSIPGWDSITNASSGAVGNFAETPQQFEQRRAQSVAKNSMGPSAAVQGAVLSVPGVLDAYTIDNPTASPVTIQGVTIAANSMFCCVEGGADADVALAIWQHKAPGCGMTGSTSVTVTDSNSGYTMPLPSYTISFQRPAMLNAYFLVTIANSALVPANALALIQAAIAETFSGTQTDPNFNSFSTRARIGGTIYTSDYIPNIALLGSWARVISIGVGTNNVQACQFTGSIAANNVMTVTAIATGALAVGEAVRGSTTLPGTQILSQLTGSAGSTGTYSVSGGPQVVTSSSGLRAIAMTLPDTTVNLGQFPVFSNANAFLTLV